MNSRYFDFFLLAINAENAVHKSDKFMAMAVRTRQEYLKDLALNHVVSSSIDSGSRLSKFTHLGVVMVVNFVLSFSPLFAKCCMMLKLLSCSAVS